MTSHEKIRILALHGGMTCGRKFRSGTMKKVIRSMKDIVEFDFVDAPFLARCPIFEEGMITGYQEGDLSQEKRSWWNWNNKDPQDDRYAVDGHEQEGMFYHGLEQSLEMLWTVWNNARENKKPFDGIFAFSQGAITASIFADWMTQHEARPKFMILVSAFLKPVPLNYPDYWMRKQDKLPPLEVFERKNPAGFDPTDAGTTERWEMVHGDLQEKKSLAADFVSTKETISNIPSLHIFGKNDTIMPNSRSLALAVRYSRSERFNHSFKRGHDVPSDEEDLRVIRSFIERHAQN